MGEFIASPKAAGLISGSIPSRIAGYIKVDTTMFNSRRKATSLFPLLGCLALAVIVGGGALAASTLGGAPPGEVIGQVEDNHAVSVAVQYDDISTRNTYTVLATEHSDPHSNAPLVEHNHTHTDFCLHEAVKEPQYSISTVMVDSPVVWCPDNPGVLVSDGCPVSFDVTPACAACLW